MKAAESLPKRSFDSTLTPLSQLNYQALKSRSFVSYNLKETISFEPIYTYSNLFFYIPKIRSQLSI